MSSMSVGSYPWSLPAPPGSLVMVSSGGSDEEEKANSEATWEGAGETYPPRQTDLLRVLSNDDDTGEYPVKESLRSAGVTTRSRGTPPKKLKLGVPKKGRSALTPRGDAPTSSPAATIAKPVVRLSAPEGTTAPMPTQPAGLALLKRTRDYVATDQ